MTAFLATFTELYLSEFPGYYFTQRFLDRFRKRLVPEAVYHSPKKLNLGSSTRALPDYVNVDALEERKPDVVCDVRKLTFARDDEFDLVRASHLLEHFAPEEVIDVLAEWRRVLKPGGYLVLCVPDYLRMSWRAILKPSGFYIRRREVSEWISGVYALDLPPELRHKVVFTEKSLRELLAEAEFEVVGREHFRAGHPFRLGVMDDSCHPLSMNLVARKRNGARP